MAHKHHALLNQPQHHYRGIYLKPEDIKLANRFLEAIQNPTAAATIMMICATGIVGAVSFVVYIVVNRL